MRDGGGARGARNRRGAAPAWSEGFLAAVTAALFLSGIVHPVGAGGTTGVASGGGSRAGGGLRVTDALGAVGGGKAGSGGVQLLAGLLPSVTGVTPVTLVSLSARLTAEGAPLLEWVLTEDSDPVGFHVFAGPSAEGPWLRLTARMLDAEARSYVDERPVPPAPVGDPRWFRVAAVSRGGGEVLWTLAVSVTPRALSPSRLGLPPNTPNPFHSVTTLIAELPLSGPVRLEVFDATGRCVALLFEGDLSAGRHALVWNGDTRAGRAASGVYWVRLMAAGQAVSRKIVVRR